MIHRSPTTPTRHASALLLLSALSALGCFGSVEERADRAPLDSSQRRQAALSELYQAQRRRDYPSLRDACETRQYRGYPWAAEHQRRACQYARPLEKLAKIDTRPCDQHRKLVLASPRTTNDRELIRLYTCGESGLFMDRLLARQPSRMSYSMRQRPDEQLMHVVRLPQQEVRASLLKLALDDAAQQPASFTSAASLYALGQLIVRMTPDRTLTVQECRPIGQVFEAQVKRGADLSWRAGLIERLIAPEGCVATLNAVLPGHLDALGAKVQASLKAPPRSRASGKLGLWVSHATAACQLALKHPTLATREAMDRQIKTFQDTSARQACARAHDVLLRAHPVAPLPAQVSSKIE